MIRARTTLASLMGLALLSACSSIQVDHDYDESVDFASLTTYAWPPQPAVPDSVEAKGGGNLLITQVQSAVDAVLEGKGLKQVAVADASFLITQRLSVAEQIRVNDPFYAYDQYTVYDEGTLLLDFEDPETKQVIWRGTGQARLQDHPTPEERQARIRQVVDAILADYPPQ